MFSRFAHWASHQSGRAYAFVGAIVVILLWAVSGPLFGFSDTWQLVINTGTTIITFLMVFLIQNTQNRDTQAIQLKLDELIRATQDARNNLMNLEDRSDAELEKLKQQFSDLSGVALEVSEAAKKVRES
jgi:low affinity Fe/Cu permease